MSEQRIAYLIDGAKNIEWFKNQKFSRKFIDPEFVHPTFQDIKELRIFTGWNQAEMAGIVGVSYKAGKGATSIRKWCSDPQASNEARKIPYAAWRLFLIAARIVNK